MVRVGLSRRELDWNGTEDGTSVGTGVEDGAATSGNWTSISASTMIIVLAKGESAGWMNVTRPVTLLVLRATVC